MKLSHEEFERLAIEQMDMLYRVARRLTRHGAQAEDLVQETYLRAFKAIDQFDCTALGIRPWLLRILHNLYVSRAQHDGKQPVSIAEEQLENVCVPGAADGLTLDPRSFDRMDEHLVHAIESLAPDYQHVLMLWALEELSYKEIADALSVPVGTVMSRLHRARQRLIILLHDYARSQGLIRE